MAFVLSDRVKETTTTTGTGTISLAGAVTGFQDFDSRMADGDTTRYCIENTSAGEWEVGVGTFTSGTPDTLARTSVLRSSNGDAAVNFSAGTKNVFMTIDSGSNVPPGTVQDYAGTTEPYGWLFCYGQEISRTTYAALFSAIGTTYGVGDGSTTFNLPDIRGRVVAGQDDMGGTSANRLTSPLNGDTLGAAGGDENLQQHNHGVTDPGHLHSSSSRDSNVGGGYRNGAHSGGFGVTVSSNSNTTGISVDNAGTGSGQNVQPTIILNKIIKI